MYCTLLDSVADPDLPDHLGKSDTHQSEKAEPDPRQSQIQEL
jgi:hypothetical protein